MNPKQVLAVLAARWPLALAVLLLSVSASAIVSTTMLKRYTATAAVMLDARTPDQAAGGATPSLLPGGYMATQVDVLFSERVGRAVIESVGLREDRRWREAWHKAGGGSGDYEAWLSEKLSKALSVRPAPASNVVTIGYESDDSSYAAKMANAYVKAYVDISLQLRAERMREFGGHFDTRAQVARAELERAQAKLTDFQQRTGLLTGDDKVNVESARLAELSTQLLVAQGANAEMAGRMRQAGNQPDQLQEVWRNPAVAALTGEVNREEVRLRELTARLGESHPQLIEQQARLNELRAKLVAEKGKAVSNVGFDSGAAQNRVAHLSAALEAQRAKLLRLQGQREQMTAIQRELETAQRAFEQVQQRASLVNLESQNTQANVTVLKQATPPVEPSSPNLIKSIGASVVGGLALGIGLVLLREQFDRRLRSAEDLLELKQHMLVSLPVSAHASDAIDTSRTRLMKQRVLTGLPRPTAQQPS
jgi:succinoglycan biosynthesis transport protein ExoP